MRVRALAAAAVLCLSLSQIVTAQAPRRDLAADERCGGHTLERHVGRTNAQLAQRLREQPDISAASTYPDRETAELTVGAALAKERARIAAWTSRRGSRPNLALHYHATGRPIGRSWQRGAIAPVSCLDALVVLRWDSGRHGFCVLTSYPEVGR